MPETRCPRDVNNCRGISLTSKYVFLKIYLHIFDNRSRAMVDYTHAIIEHPVRLMQNKSIIDCLFFILQSFVNCQLSEELSCAFRSYL